MNTKDKPTPSNEMKAGDILISSTNTPTSVAIRIFTFSKYSHAAIAVSNELIIETISTGARLITLADFLQNNNKVFLLKRPEELRPEQLLILKTSTEDLKSSKYNTIRAINSGTSRIALFAWTLSVITVTTFISIKNHYLVFTFYAISMLILLFVIYAASESNRSNKIAKALKIRDSLHVDITRNFCSQMVLDIEKSMKGDLIANWRKINEPTPSDLEELAIKSGFELIKIK